MNTVRRPSDRDDNWRPPVQGQSSLHRLNPHACRLILQTHRSVHCTPPKNNQKLIDENNKKTNTKHIILLPVQGNLWSGVSGLRHKQKWTSVTLVLLYTGTPFTIVRMSQ